MSNPETLRIERTIIYKRIVKLRERGASEAYLEPLLRELAYLDRAIPENEAAAA
jgi:hypothetical protein